MKILFTRFPLESTYGGTEIQTLSLMKGLIAKGHAVAFLGSCPTLLQKCREEAIPFAELQIGSPPVSKLHVLTFFWRKQKMKQLLEKALDGFSGIDALCMLSLSEKILLTPYAIKKGIPMYWIEHDRVGSWLTKNPWLPQLKELSKKVMTIVVSDLSKKIYEELGWDENKVIAIPNGIDLTRFSSAQKSKNKNLHVGCIARLSPEKGIDVLLQAIADLPEVSLQIVGQGKEEGYLRSLISSMDHGIEPRVQIDHSVDLQTFYNSIDALVLPSREHDPFGLVAAEAMNLGVPVIVTDACGIATYLTNKKDAIIVKADSVKELTLAIKKMADEAFRLELAKNGQKTAHEKFSLKRMVDSYESVFTGNS